jgi:hypothetical protein
MKQVVGRVCIYRFILFHIICHLCMHHLLSFHYDVFQIQMNLFYNFDGMLTSFII